MRWNEVEQLIKEHPECRLGYRSDPRKTECYIAYIDPEQKHYFGYLGSRIIITKRQAMKAHELYFKAEPVYCKKSESLVITTHERE